jgi:lipopolysaccharide transport system permease protein
MRDQRSASPTRRWKGRREVRATGMSHSPRYLLDVVLTLVERELRIRYKGSILGILWAVLSPLGTVLILHVLFGSILQLGIPNYASFIYTGLLPWTWFQAATYTSAATLSDNRDLVRKPFFPRQLLPGVVTLTNFILYLLALPVMFLLLMIEGLSLTPALLLLPLVWFGLGLFTLAVALWVAALGVLVRDIQHMLGVVMLLWFYLTPIFYDPYRISPQAARWLMLNPVGVLVQAHREVVLYGQAPDLPSLGMALAAGTILLAGGLAFFQALEDVFVEEV